LQEEVKVYGHVMGIRRLGSIVFIVLRTFDGIEQVTIKKKEVSPETWKIVSELGSEYFIEVKGTMIKSTIAKLGREIIAKEIKIISPSSPPPIDLSEKVPAEFPTRIKYRYLDIRKPRIRAIFRIRATVVQAAREFLTKKGFVELQFPIIIATATEGGANLFPVRYFDRTAYLVQSAQLYKQSAIPAFGKVFTIGPSFRAEKSRTRKHLTEFWQIDVEAAMVTKDGLMDLQFNLVKYIYEKVLERNENDLKVLGLDLEVPDHYEKIGYDEALEILKRKGIELPWGEDFGAEEERALCESFTVPFFVTEFPEGVVAFYYKVDENNPKIAHRIDFFGPGTYGVEWSSGGLREHDPKKLEERMKAKGLNPKSFGWYLEMFKYGFPPHGGFGLGVERLLQTMLKLDKIHEAILYPRTPDILEP